LRLEVFSRAPQTTPRPSPLLFVHGILHSAWYWEKFLGVFAARGYEAHALSLSGHGNSPGNIRWIRSPQLIRDVAEVAARFSSPPIVIGHSMGAYITQKYLETHSAPAAVLLASVPHFGAIPATMRFFAHHPLQLLKCVLTLDMRPIVESPQLAREILYWRDTPEAIVAANFARLQGDSFFTYLDLMALNLPRPGRIKTPMLVIGSEHDGIFTPGEIAATAKRYGADLHIFPNMGHNLILDVGWENVAEKIAVWLDARGL